MKSDVELPDDVIYSLLLNLPTKALLRFRTVSKQWNEIITSRAFAKHRSSKPSRADHLFAHRLWYNCTILHYTKLNYNHDVNVNDSSCHGGGRRLPTTPAAKFHLPPNWYEYNDPTGQGGYWYDSSSCDGMLCTPRYETDHTANLLVWNPFTRQFRRVPWPVVYTERRAVRDSFIGMGYDHVIHDYKIVVNTHDFSVSVSRTYIFNLKSSSDVWRRIDELSAPWGRRESKPVTLDSGDVYWVSWCNGAMMRDRLSEECYRKPRNWSLEERFLILKFSLTDERLTIMPSPSSTDHDLHDSLWRCQLGEYEESLCCFNYRPYMESAPGTHWIHIWTLLTAAGDEPTWVRAANVPFGPSYVELIPMGFTVSGDLMMRIYHAHPHVRGVYDAGDLMVYVAREDKFVVVRLEDDAESGLKRAAYYHHLRMESLISPN